MAFTQVGKGCDSPSMWGYEETAFGTLGATMDNVFGNGATVNISQNNNTERLYALGDRNAKKLVAKKYEGSWNTDFVLGNADWMTAAIGTMGSISGSGPYVRTFSENNTCPSISIANAFNLDTDSRHNILGAKVNSMSIDCNVGEIARVKLDGFFQKLSKTTTIGSTTSGDSEDPMIFAGASIKLGSTATLDVQSMNITLTNNTEMLFSLGSRFASKGVEKAREYSFKINEAYEDDTLLHDPFLGSATIAATGGPANLTELVATFTNGLSTTFSRILTATFNTIQLPTYDYSMAIEEITKEDVTLWALESEGFTYTNNSSTTPTA